MHVGLSFLFEVFSLARVCGVDGLPSFCLPIDDLRELGFVLGVLLHELDQSRFHHLSCSSMVEELSVVDW